MGRTTSKAPERAAGARGAAPGRALSDLAVLRRLLGEARGHWRHIGLLLGLDLLATPLALLTPLPLKLVVDSVLGDEPLPGFVAAALPAPVAASPEALLVAAVALLVVVNVLVHFQSAARRVLYMWTGERLVVRFRSRLFEHSQRMSLAYHDLKGTNDALYRIQYDAPAIQWVAIDGMIPFITAMVTLAGMVFVTASIDAGLAMVALMVAPVLVLLTALYRQPLRDRWRHVAHMDSGAMAVISETLSALRVVKAFVQEDREHRRFTLRSRDSVRAKLRAGLVQGSYDLFSGIAIAAGMAAVLFLGARGVMAGAITLGDLLVVMAYLALLYGPLKAVGQQLSSLQKSLASAERAFVLLDEREDVPERADAHPLERARGRIEFHDVGFGYAPGEPVLGGVSLAIPAGARAGIIGRTGAGKSTLVSLLSRFYDPDGGAVLLDGVDVRDYRVRDLRRQFGIVLQEPVLFSSSIRENIAYARPDASDAEIVDAAKAAEAHEFICALPRGYDTVVGERGLRLSGGERQRVALARAFLKDAPILILDEPTSAVDVRTEALIMTAMERLMAGRTTVMIAHRLSTLTGCDVVFQVADGKVAPVELGDVTPATPIRSA